MLERSRAIPYSNHGVERETRLELATLTLARYASNSVFRRGQNRLLNDYFPPTSTGIHARHTGIHGDHTGRPRWSSTNAAGGEWVSGLGPECSTGGGKPSCAGRCAQGEDDGLDRRPVLNYRSLRGRPSKRTTSLCRTSWGAGRRNSHLGPPPRAAARPSAPATPPCRGCRP